MCTYSLCLCVMPSAGAVDGVKPPGLAPIGGRFGIKPPGLTPIGGRFGIKPPGLAPIGVGFCFKPPGLAPIGVGFCFKPPGLAPIGGRFCFKPPGLAPIGVGFCFKPLVWLQSEVCFASNHWFGPNRGRVLLRTIGLAQSRAGLGSNQRRFDPNQAPQRGCRFTVRYSLRAGVRPGSPCRWRRRRR